MPESAGVIVVNMLSLRQFLNKHHRSSRQNTLFSYFGFWQVGLNVNYQQNKPPIKLFKNISLINY
jgi:hypothetical protein